MLVISCATVYLLLSVAWAIPHGMGHGGHSNEVLHHLSPANMDFAFKLYRSMSVKHDKNIFFSPLSITTALSMLSLGSRGETHSQLLSTLGYYSSLNQDQVNHAYEHILHMMDHDKDAMQLEMGNALALGDDVEPLAMFQEDAMHYYASEVLSVNFHDIVQAEVLINQLIAMMTHNHLTDMVKGLDTDTVMVLINYSWFRAKWVKPFDATMTAKADFHVDEKTTVEVDMMRRTGLFDFYQDRDDYATVIMLPYKGNASMMIILPDEGKMKEVEGYINKDYIKHWQDSLFRSSVTLAMPKLSISASSCLGHTLKEMGMVNAFGDAADFSGIAETKLKVSKIEHKAVLTIDETGTTAAAVTTIEMMPHSMPETLTLNRPFLLLIMEHTTESILFMGKVSDPTHTAMAHA